MAAPVQLLLQKSDEALQVGEEEFPVERRNRHGKQTTIRFELRPGLEDQAGPRFSAQPFVVTGERGTYKLSEVLHLFTQRQSLPLRKKIDIALEQNAMGSISRGERHPVMYIKTGAWIPHRTQQLQALQYRFSSSKCFRVLRGQFADGDTFLLYQFVNPFLACVGLIRRTEPRLRCWIKFRTTSFR